MSIWAGGRIEIIDGDITTCEVDAIVNAANAALTGGGGVDGAIHRAAGPELLEACRGLGGAHPGEARITAGYGLPARFVIHAVGPVWSGGARGEDFQLSSCYLKSLELAIEHDCRTVAFPAISTGAYRFPLERATEIAIGSVQSVLGEDDTLDRVVLCCFGRTDLAMYERVAGRLLAP